MPPWLPLSFSERGPGSEAPRLLTLLLFALLSTLPAAHARIALPRILGHSMVLQRERPVPIWGTAAPGEAVTVQFAGQQQRTTANAAGHWQVLLQPLRASATPAELTISGPANTIRLHDVLVGEVWLASGQSNMEYTMRKNSKVTRPNVPGQNPVDELDYAHNPAIRIFLVNRKTLARPDSTHRNWSIAQDSALRAFSAAAYFFAKELHQQLQVPVGVISSAVPGSRIEPWVAEAAFAKDPVFGGQKIDGDPGKFYESMIEPLAPFALRGFLWYQGESSCYLAETTTYTQKMRTLISSWRSTWHDADLPFYYVSLAPFHYSQEKAQVPLTRETLPRLREAQAAALQIPHTGMIETTDLATAEGGIHPGFKWEIGRRLALQALRHTYKKKEVVADGPVFDHLKVRGRKAVVYFQSLSAPLVSQDNKPLTHFEVAGPDGVFHPAQARIKGKQVEVQSDAVKHPTSVRFGWDELAQPNLFAGGLPARPFRSNKPADVVSAR
ncbi:sialate O-acetylesterase [Hymenobacter aerilatus]|uniref:Sialate O-acetylesterase n=1 Tax=Hymenobacter aerilatus TaxID=2932251 RepID=A0A8T9SNG0_9BACT|nr:sialate O-acetylesterase [Hymenobacter aerilatus]UOR03582.1 sialate O-acetylesterase [Hymenobacter aerilatus]